MLLLVSPGHLGHITLSLHLVRSDACQNKRRIVSENTTTSTLRVVLCFPIMSSCPHSSTRRPHSWTPTTLSLWWPLGVPSCGWEQVPVTERSREPSSCAISWECRPLRCPKGERAVRKKDEEQSTDAPFVFFGPVWVHSVWAEPAFDSIGGPAVKKQQHQCEAK